MDILFLITTTNWSTTRWQRSFTKTSVIRFTDRQKWKFLVTENSWRIEQSESCCGCCWACCCCPWRVAVVIRRGRPVAASAVARLLFFFSLFVLRILVQINWNYINLLLSKFVVCPDGTQRGRRTDLGPDRTWLFENHLRENGSRSALSFSITHISCPTPPPVTWRTKEFRV